LNRRASTRLLPIPGHRAVGVGLLSLLTLFSLVWPGLATPASFALDQPMDQATALAMLKRFGYGADAASLAATQGQTPREYLRRSITGPSRLPPAVQAHIDALPLPQPLDAVWKELGPGGSQAATRRDPEARKALMQRERQMASASVQARLLTLANSDNPGHEALLSFWLNHVSVFAPKSFVRLLAWDYARALEAAMAQDSFEALLRASFYHPAMQVYLDNAQSTAPTSQAARRMGAFSDNKPDINENLARELLELHTLGVDAGYGQRDVQELARILTGAGVYSPRMRDQALKRAGAHREGLFLFDPRRHDFGTKTLLGETFHAGQGKAEIDRALHLLATHPATAHRIASKLAQRFLADAPPEAVVEAMARGFRQSGGRISATLEPLLASRAFADSLANPGKFREPLDYLIASSRAVCSGGVVGNGQLPALLALDLGEAPFMRSTPDGCGARESDWLSPAAMAKRVRLAMGLANERLPLAQGEGGGGKLRPGVLQPISNEGLDRAQLTRGQACKPSAEEVARFTGELSPQTRQAAAGLGQKKGSAELVAFLLASPEFMRR